MDLNGQRILFIKQSSLGDVVHALPVAHALKRCFPRCSIGWVVERGYAALVESDDAVDAVYPIHIPSTSSPGASRIAYGAALSATIKVLRDLRRSFKSAPYDIVLDLHASFRSGVIALANPGGIRYGFRDARELNTLFQDRLIDVPSDTVHAVDKNLLFASCFSCAAQPVDFHLCSSDADAQAASQFLLDQQMVTTERFVYVNPTARWQSKYWIASRWSELCERLIGAGIQPVLGGSGADVPYIEEIVAGMDKKPVVSAGKLALGASVDLIQRATAYIGLDTGPMHIAAMAGVPVVALFGPTHPERVGPYGVRRVIVRAEGVECLCCRKRVCEQMDCMRGISVDRVFSAIMELI
ncbi:MAG: glycosyltransferase family 9 protein [Desulfobulbus sp.]